MSDARAGQEDLFQIPAPGAGGLLNRAEGDAARPWFRTLRSRRGDHSPTPPYFIGRRKILKEIVEELRTPGHKPESRACFLIGGYRGVGKTTTVDCAFSRRRVPVVAMIPELNEEQIGELFSAGFDDQIEKPLRFEALEGRVQRWFGGG